MKLVSANIKCNPTMSQPRVVHDTKAVAGMGGVLLWQEIYPYHPRYAEAVKNIPGPFKHRWLNLESPISFKDTFWEEVEELSGSKLTHKGRVRVTPNRYVTWVGLQRKHSKIPPVIFMNTHYVSGAFSNHYPATKKWRRARWDTHFKVQKDIVLDFNRRGFTVIGGGDTNRVAMPKFAPHQRWLSSGGIDHLFCLEAPKGAKVKVHQSYAYHGKVYTDHKPRIAELYLS